tara:strand:- start:2358 stop:2528 length:171 start_codon:yes stop_codon:yes gene_type:complete
MTMQHKIVVVVVSVTVVIINDFIFERKTSFFVAHFYNNVLFVFYNPFILKINFDNS